VTAGQPGNTSPAAIGLTIRYRLGSAGIAPRGVAERAHSNPGFPQITQR